MSTRMNIKCVIIGDRSVGKTSICNRFVYNTFQALYAPTIGFDLFSKRIIKNNVEYRIVLWDLMGDQELRVSRKDYYMGAMCALLVYDVSRIGTFQHIPDWFEELKINLGKNYDIPCAVVANKQDLENKKMIDNSKGEKLAKKYNTIFWPTSAKTGQGVGEVIIELVTEVISK
ncbi:MAG: Rab family GTPase [Candidatus Wukongarchaeota archaeon]|nr:Rab family GTPase [Candidatus Wukongarchaeota archaeon]